MATTVLRSTDALPAGPRSAVTIGVYDGVHAGHRWLLRKLRQVASRERLRSVVVTFDPHPLRVLRPVSAPRMLTDIDQRLELLEATGLVDVCLVIPFDEAVSRRSPSEFVRSVLVDQLRTATVVVGADFRFGHNRSGGVAELAQLGSRYGFSTLPLPLLPVASTGGACSSTYLRSLIAQGEIERASALLGRAYEVSGRVVSTSRPTAGRGIPTVVIRVGEDRSLPVEGSYAGSVRTADGRQRSAGVSVRQGLSGGPALLDAHVVGDVRRLMDERVRVRMSRRLWTHGKDELFGEMVRVDEEAGWSLASGGWAAMS
jgi:riboflavin kinase / FMN adenylyltransferase